MLKSIRKQSAKARKRQRAWAKVVRECIKERGPMCQIRRPWWCRGYAEGGHHKLKRSQGGPDTKENCLLACNACNLWIEDEPDLAFELGFTIRGLISTEDR